MKCEKKIQIYSSLSSLQKWFIREKDIFIPKIGPISGSPAGGSEIFINVVIFFVDINHWINRGKSVCLFGFMKYKIEPSKKSPIAMNGFVNGPRPNDMPYPKSQYVTWTVDEQKYENIKREKSICVYANQRDETYSHRVQYQQYSSS